MRLTCALTRNKPDSMWQRGILIRHCCWIAAFNVKGYRASGNAFGPHWPMEELNCPRICSTLLWKHSMSALRFADRRPDGSCLDSLEHSRKSASDVCHGRAKDIGRKHRSLLRDGETAKAQHRLAVESY